jgi:hypothetical protein
MFTLHVRMGAHNTLVYTYSRTDFRMARDSTVVVTTGSEGLLQSFIETELEEEPDQEGPQANGERVGHGVL